MQPNNTSILDQKTMQGLLPDYAFGRLGEDERVAFERSLPHHPQIELELREVREVFSRVERTEFVRHYERKSRNLPVNVLNRREKKSKTGRYSRFHLLPALGIITAAILIVTLNYSPETTTTPFAIQPLLVQKDADAVALQSTPDELAEAVFAINPAIVLPQQDYEPVWPVISAAATADAVASVSYPVNTGTLEEDLVADLSDDEFSTILKNSHNDASL